MKTARRQELKTNDLSQQIEQIGDYVKKNALMLTAVTVAVIVIVGGGFWYSGEKDRQVLAGWDALTRDAILDIEGDPISRFEDVANQNITPGLTAAAWLQVGTAAMVKAQEFDTDLDAVPTAEAADNTDWTAKARDAFEKVVKGHAGNLTAAGHAMTSLGVIEENAGNLDKARGWYRKILDDSRYAAYPFHAIAKRRLDGLDSWSSAVVFAPAPPMPVGGPMSLEGNTPILTPTITPAPTPDTPGKIKPRRLSKEEVDRLLSSQSPEKRAEMEAATKRPSEPPAGKPEAAPAKEEGAANEEGTAGKEGAAKEKGAAEATPGSQAGEEAGGAKE